VVNWLQKSHGWQVPAEALVFLPGVVSGFNLTCCAFTSPGDSALVPTPIYPAILKAPTNAGIGRDVTQLTQQPNGQYTVDFDALEAAITEHTRIFLLCNPHNPTGRVFRRDELERMAQICLRHNLLICSDEIYNDWVFDDRRHLPIASIDPEIGARTITLMGTSKSCNLAGIKCAVAVVENAELRRRLNAVREDLIPSVNALAYTAAVAGFRYAQPWQDAVLCYLEANRDFLVQYVRKHLPGIQVSKPEGTPLAWLDCRQAAIPNPPSEFFLQKASVALNDGEAYGRGGKGFVRLAFGCPRGLLRQGLDRMKEALRDL
jgi:cystathionine beta-lyase